MENLNGTTGRSRNTGSRKAGSAGITGDAVSILGRPIDDDQVKFMDHNLRSVHVMSVLDTSPHRLGSWGSIPVQDVKDGGSHHFHVSSLSFISERSKLREQCMSMRKLRPCILLLCATAKLCACELSSCMLAFAHVAADPKTESHRTCTRILQGSFRVNPLLSNVVHPPTSPSAFGAPCFI
jgi:hypothetical protein